jgi:glycogen(starch) synthase
MRLCFVSRKFPPTLSGMSVYAHNLCRKLVDARVDLTVVSQYRPDPLGSSVYADGPPVPLEGARVIGMPQTNEAARGDFESDIAHLVDTICALHAEAPFDLLHAQYGYPPGLAAALAAQRLGLPVAVSLQGGDGHWFGTCCAQHYQTMEWILANASAILMPTRSFRDRVVARYGEIGRQLVLPGAVDVGIFARDEALRRLWRQRLDLHADEAVVIYHGRFDFRKGLRELIEAFAALPQRLRDRCVLVLAGVGPDNAEFKALVAASLAPRAYRWLGLVPYEELPGLLSAGDLHCSPTYQEGFSNTLAEAAACGLPLLTTDTVGVGDVYRHRETAWLVPIRDAQALRVGFETLLDDEGLRASLGRNVRELVATRYDWSALASRLTRLYETLTPVRAADLPPAFDASERCRYRENPVLL